MFLFIYWQKHLRYILIHNYFPCYSHHNQSLYFNVIFPFLAYTFLYCNTNTQPRKISASSGTMIDTGTFFFSITLSYK